VHIALKQFGSCATEHSNLQAVMSNVLKKCEIKSNKYLYFTGIE
jgi:hypothetical protein